MADSIREVALARLFVLLQGIAGVTVLRNPNHSLGPEDLPAVAQFDGGESVEESATGSLRLGIRVAVACTVKASDAAGLGAALSDLRAKVRVAIAADFTLGGLASIVRYVGCDDPVVVAEEGVAPIAALICDFIIECEEAALDPYQQ